MFSLSSLEAAWTNVVVEDTDLVITVESNVADEDGVEDCCCGLDDIVVSRSILDGPAD